MPEIEVNVEVYCGTCGEGLCNQTTFAKTRSRNEPSLRVEVCPRCIAEKDSEIDDLKHQIKELEEENLKAR
jgi:hypothetical protein